MNHIDYHKLRNNMVEKQIQARNITDVTVLEAMRRVPRHEFVPEKIRFKAYDDCPLPIGEGQTISQPYMVALMTQCLLLNKDKSVFEIGTGSGYQTAVLAQLCKTVYTIERIAKILDQAKDNLQNYKYTNIKTFFGDGTCGLQEEPQLFDAIIITAASPSRPEKLISQLAMHGRLVVPVGGRASQMLMLFTKCENKIAEEAVCGCTFVPLVGQYGWSLN